HPPDHFGNLTRAGFRCSDIFESRTAERTVALGQPFGGYRKYPDFNAASLSGSSQTMNIFQAIVFGLVQGITEFLPVSSTAHLILLPWFMGWPDPGLSFDVALHLGTLIAL